MHCNCLIVDDEAELAQMTKEYFEMFNVSCEYVTTTKDCETFLRDNTVDLILLDINLESDSGFNLCKKIRQDSDVPILFISARQSDDDVLIALNIGGDDYIKKPYVLSVLLAKVKVTLKRLAKSEERHDESCGDIRICPDQLKVYIKDREVILKSKEFKLFSYLFTNRNKIVTKDQLFTNVWGDEFFSDGTLNVHIRKLREKIEEDPNDPVFIKTIWGTGYMLEI